MKTVNTVDLFCGAGGAETGLSLALRDCGLQKRGLAINHWHVAVETMNLNHKDTRTLNMDLSSVVPSDVADVEQVDVLWASPSCTHHSRAKGGKPRDRQLRAQPELILTWLDQLYVVDLVVENVPEFVTWGPLTKSGRPDKQMVGACFRAWVDSIKARGYVVEWRVLCCADFGDATTRKRFFLRARKRTACRRLGPIRWPEQTHTGDLQDDLFRELKPWRGVVECLDLNNIGRSIFNREKPLAKNTLRRICSGLKRFYGKQFQMDMLGMDEPEAACRVLPVDAPLPTQHCGGNRTALVTPFIVRFNKGYDSVPIEQPLPAVTTGGHYALVRPLVYRMAYDGAMWPVDALLASQTCQLREAMVTPVVQNGVIVDVFLRMLTPEELARAHSFPEGYVLTGNKRDQVKQIGNSVPVETARAICRTILEEVK